MELKSKPEIEVFVLDENNPQHNPKQIEFWDVFWRCIGGELPYRYLFYGGAVRGGKSSLCLTIFHFLARVFPKSRWHIIRESFTDLQDTTIPSFEKFFPENSTKTIKRYNRAQNNFHIDYVNGSKIFFRSENIIHDPALAWMDGLESNGIFLEQMEGLSEKTFNKALERAGSWYLDNMPPPIILGTFNPTQNWVKHKIYDKYKDGILESPYYFLEALPTDNPFITDEQWDSWENMDSLSYAQRIEGDWSAFESTSKWAHAFNETKHTGIVENHPLYDIYLSFDFNASPVTVTVWQYFDSKIRCLYELESNVGLADLCRKIQELIGEENGELKQNVFVTGDRSGYNKSELLEGNRTAYDIIKKELNLSKYQINTPQVNPNLLKSRELVNGILEKHPHFLISNIHCKKLIFDLKFCESEDDHSIKKDRTKKAGKADYLDGLRYYLNTYHQDFIRL